MPVIKNLHDLLQYMPPENGLDYNKTFKHTAVLFRRGKFLAAANNQLGSRESGCGNSCYTIHAEANCIKKIGNFKMLEGATMYVFRTGKGCNSDNFCNSRPCQICELILTKCMIKHGLLRVFYSVHRDDDIELIKSQKPKQSKDRRRKA